MQPILDRIFAEIHKLEAEYETLTDFSAKAMNLGKRDGLVLAANIIQGVK